MSGPSLVSLELLSPRVHDRGVADVDEGRKVGEARFTRHRRWGLFFAVLWCVFLLQPLVGGWERRATTGWIGIAATLGFAVLYVVAFQRWMRRSNGRGSARDARADWGHLAVLSAVTMLMVATAGPDGAVAAVYVVIAATFRLPFRVAATIAVVVAALLWLLARRPGYETLGGVWVYAFIGLAVSVSMVQLMRRNVELVRARAENERLVLEAERLRMARDLHDILGHSLTVITVKAELAGALMDAAAPSRRPGAPSEAEAPSSLGRARAEVADLERLARDALADVRATAHGYREVSLPSEIARAGEALRAAGIAADLPGAADVVPTPLRETFAWAVREGVTNVVRHSGASRCQVVLEADRVRVSDDGGDGAGCADGTVAGGDGAGLAGLRERAAAVGATVTAARGGDGFVLEVSR